MQKSLARKSIQSRLAASRLSFPSASHLISETLKTLFPLETLSSVAVYLAKDDEVNVDEFISYLLSSNVEVCAPAIKDGEMKFYRLNSISDVKIGAYGIREPISSEIAISPSLIIVPIVGFMRDMSRLGHGKGYYDRLLSAFSGKRVGVAFSLQEEEFEAEGHDEKLDMIVTEREIIYG